MEKGFQVLFHYSRDFVTLFLLLESKRCFLAANTPYPHKMPSAPDFLKPMAKRRFFLNGWGQLTLKSGTYVTTLGLRSPPLPCATTEAPEEAKKKHRSRNNILTEAKSTTRGRWRALRENPGDLGRVGGLASVGVRAAARVNVLSASRARLFFIALRVFPGKSSSKLSCALTHEGAGKFPPLGFFPRQLFLARASRQGAMTALQDTHLALLRVWFSQLLGRLALALDCPQRTQLQVRGPKYKSKL